MTGRKLCEVAALAAFLAAIGLGTGSAQRADAATASDTAKPAGGATTAPASGREAMDAEHVRKAESLLKDGIAFLLANADKEGGWSLGEGHFRPAATAMVLKILLQDPRYDASSPLVKQGFEVLLKSRQKDGGIYNPSEGQQNYTTALAVTALAAARSQGYETALKDAVTYLRRLQIVPGSESPDGQKIDEGHAWVGGVSYGRHGRPDLSNEGYWLDAMQAAGVPGDDPDVKRALAFVVRCQNRSESNPMAWAAGADPEDQGGFIYAPGVKADLKKGESMAGESRGGRGLRSYGSMTYVGFKAMLYANVAKDDPRVTAAYEWIRRFWTLESNPNMPEAKSLQGLYYYYHVYAKALRAWGAPVIRDARGKEHNWRQELVAALATKVKKDGSWANEADRWEEASPTLVTCYAILALQEAMK